MMKKKKIIAGMVSVALLLSGCGGSTTEKVASLSKLGVDKSEIITSDKTDIKDTTYLLETTYSGADVPIELYDVPFQKTEYYISNKDFSDTLSKKSSDAQAYIDTATACTGTLFGNNYTDILSDQDAFTADLSEYFAGDEYMFGAYTDEMINSILEAYVDNKLEVTASFITDGSLVYNDILYYLRGVVEITVRGGDAAAYEQVFGIKTAKNQKVRLMVEYAFEPNNPDSIVRADILGYIQ